MLYRLILAPWLRTKDTRNVIERELEWDQLIEFNKQFYNCYYLPNYPSKRVKGRAVHGRDVDMWGWVFADMDLKDKVWPSKEAFIEEVKRFALPPTSIVDSGNGVHVYWKLTDLDPMSYLRLQRRICRFFKTDEAVANMYQLMRVPETVNVKHEDPERWSMCEVVDSNAVEYDCQTLDKYLPKISIEDEEYCKDHYARTTQDPSQLAPKEAAVLPAKWFQLLKRNEEVRKLFAYENVKDRSTADYRLAHLLLAAGFKRDEARAVLMNTGKALERTSVHQYNYANNIVEKLWEEIKKPVVTSDPKTGEPVEVDPIDDIGQTVTEIIKQFEDAPQGTRFPCDPAIDATFYGYRLTEWMGLIGGSGAGKTTFCLNMFRWFFERNPEYLHVFVSLEQPVREIAARWKRMAGDHPDLHSKVVIVGNYDKQGKFRNLGFREIQEYIQRLEKKTGKKVGCVVIDHIAILKFEQTTKEIKDKLSGLCEQAKQFAVTTNTFTIVQSQTSRQKAGIGDIELDKDAAYGTGYFEFYADYIVTTWQPLKRLYGEERFPETELYINCWKYCKIRNKYASKDKVKEDQVYAFKLNLDNDRLSPLLPDDHSAYDSWAKKAVTLRNRDKKTNPAPLKVITWNQPVETPEVSK